MKFKRPSPKQPIPSHATRMLKGKIFEVYQWQQKLYNGTFATFENAKRADSVNVIAVTKEKKIILAQQEQPGIEPFVGVLGGRIDEGEDPLEAAKRELLEESGYRAKELILWESTQPLSSLDWAVYTFIAKGCEKIAEQKLDAGEKIKLLFVSFDEFLDITAQENYRDSEISLRVLKLRQNPVKLKDTRTLFLG